jgi:hypothetical protein
MRYKIIKSDIIIKEYYIINSILKAKENLIKFRNLIQLFFFFNIILEEIKND